MQEFKINDILTMDATINDEVFRIQARVRAVIENEIYLDLDGCILYANDANDDVTFTKDVYFSPGLSRLCGTFICDNQLDEIPAKLIDEKREKWLKTPIPNPPPLSRSYP